MTVGEAMLPRTFTLVAALLTAGTALGSHTVSPCDASSQVHTIDAGSETFYLVHGPEDDVVWLYWEFNGHPGLQRGGSSFYGFPHDIDCWAIEPATGEQWIEPDYIVI